MKFYNRFIFLISLAFIYFHADASDYIAIGKEGKVYDEANAKYTTLNQENEDVIVIPGMVFKNVSSNAPGWHMIEYSPGLHGYVPELILSSTFSTPNPGEYQVSNNPGENVKINLNNNNWTIISNSSTYKGIQYENIIIFVDGSDVIKYSLVDLGNGPIVINYDNSVTRFF